MTTPNDQLMIDCIAVDALAQMKAIADAHIADCLAISKTLPLKSNRQIAKLFKINFLLTNHER